jgi:hypothetical protein
MSGAEIKKPALSAGFNYEIANNSSCGSNLTHLYHHVNELCRKWKMSREEFEQAACAYALMFREYAPASVRLLYTGRPSLYSRHTKTLALAFFLAYIGAADRLEALGEPGDLDARECWKIAIDLAGGTP